jgi:hypothetical protein
MFIEDHKTEISEKGFEFVTSNYQKNWNGLKD